MIGETGGRPRHPILNEALGNAQSRGDLRMAKVLKPRQDEDVAHPLRQRIERSNNHVELLATFEKSIGRKFLVAMDRGADIGERVRPTNLAIAEIFDRKIG